MSFCLPPWTNHHGINSNPLRARQICSPPPPRGQGVGTRGGHFFRVRVRLGLTLILNLAQWVTTVIAYSFGQWGHCPPLPAHRFGRPRQLSLFCWGGSCGTPSSCANVAQLGCNVAGVAHVSKTSFLKFRQIHSVANCCPGQW